MKILLIVAMSALSASAESGISQCGRSYKNVVIDCRPRDPEMMDKKYVLTADKILEECKSYIRRQFKGKNAPDGVGWSCHQMLGGPMVIEGFGVPAKNQGRL